MDRQSGVFSEKRPLGVNISTAGGLRVATERQAEGRGGQVSEDSAAGRALPGARSARNGSETART
jgi:hypothetical protein